MTAPERVWEWDAPEHHPVEEDKENVVLVVGASGYVAQFVIEALLANDYKVHATYRPARKPEGLPERLTLHEMDMTDMANVYTVYEVVKPTVVVNCAAMSGLGACQKDPQGASLANCPRNLVVALGDDALSKQRLFIGFSTDIVFDGNPEELYDEEYPAKPVNVYGETKANFDKLLTSSPLIGKLLNCVVLRPSNILGPKAPYINSNTKFLQWVDGRLRSEEQTNLFEDEYRNYVWIADVVDVLMKLIKSFPEPSPHKLMHCGGPQALNRVQVAKTLADAKCYSLTYRDADGAEVQKIVPAKRADIDLGYPAPLCIRFRSALVEEFLGRPMRSIAECICENVSKI